MSEAGSIGRIILLAFAGLIIFFLSQFPVGGLVFFWMMPFSGGSQNLVFFAVMLVSAVLCSAAVSYFPTRWPITTRVGAAFVIGAAAAGLVFYVVLPLTGSSMMGESFLRFGGLWPVWAGGVAAAVTTWASLILGRRFERRTQERLREMRASGISAIKPVEEIDLAGGDATTVEPPAAWHAVVRSAVIYAAAMPIFSFASYQVMRFGVTREWYALFLNFAQTWIPQGAVLGIAVALVPVRWPIAVRALLMFVLGAAIGVGVPSVRFWIATQKVPNMRLNLTYVFIYGLASLLVAALFIWRRRADRKGTS